MSGTSMAAPHVTGAATLLAAAHPGLGYAEIKARLLGTADRGAAAAGASGNSNGSNNNDAGAPLLLDLQAAVRGPRATLAVRSVDVATGAPIDEMWSVMEPSSSSSSPGSKGAPISAFTPANYELEQGATYAVTAHDYQGTVFDH
jgi:subtilisin family serine protease